MPKRRSYKRPSRSHRRYTKHKRNSPSTMIARNPSIVADRYYVKLKYTAVHPGIFTGAAFTNFQIRGNSLYDPNLTGAGTQPRGFDILNQLYSKYRVLGSSIDFQLVQNSTSAATANTLVGIVPQPTTTSPSDVTDIANQPRARWRLTGPNHGSGPIRVRHYMSTRKIFGLSKREVADEDYAADVGANPSNLWIWNISSGTLDGTSTVNAESVITVTYYAVFYKRKELVAP